MGTALRAKVGFHVGGYERNVLDELVNLVELNITITQHGGLVQRVVHRLSVLAPRCPVRDEPHIELPSHPNPRISPRDTHASDEQLTE